MNVEYTNNLLNIISNLNIPEEFSAQEKAHRQRQILYADEQSPNRKICNRYYQLAHELKAAEFLNVLGRVKPALDYRHEPGADFLLNGHYQIECVCCTSGDMSKNGLSQFLCINNLNGELIDYTSERDIILQRMTASLAEKRDFYYTHICGSNPSISASKPYIIFLSLGSLVTDFFAGDSREYGIHFNDLLWGTDKPAFTVDTETSEILEVHYTSRKGISNHNGAPIDLRIFASPEYQCVSAIIFTEALLTEKYSRDNTFVFINPYAKSKIVKKDFKGLVYWDQLPDMSYAPFWNYRRKKVKV